MDEEGTVEVQQTETEAVLSFWQAFNLNEKRATWDKIGNEMREYKTVSINGRKKLNEMTKAFRAKPKEEQVLNVSELLKAYQEEIDQLSKRARFTESSYLTIYKALYEAPDPVPCIETLSNGVSNGSAHNLEIERLKSELRQYDEEFQRLKNQDITIRRLEDQLQEYRDNQEEKVVEEAERRVRVVKDQCESQIADSREAQRSAERRLAQALETVRQAQQSADRAQSQLFEEGQRYESKISALSSEHTTLLDQNQRLSLRIAELEKAASSQINSIAHSVGQQQQQHQLQLQRDTVEHMLQQHQEQLRSLEDHQRQERLKQESLVRELQQTIQREREAVVRVKAELAQCVSRVRYDHLRRELKTLRQIAFHTEEDDDDEEDDDELERGQDYNGREEVAEEDAVEEEMRRSFDDFTPEKTRPTPIKAPSLLNNINMRSPNPTPVKKKQQKKDPNVRGKEYKNSVEALLAKRLRTIEHELAVTRSDLVEARQQESTAREGAEKLRQTLEMTQQQLRKVEQDLDQRSVALEQLLLSGGGNGDDSTTVSMNPAQQQQQLADQELAALLLGDASPSPTSGSNANSSKGKVPKGMHISVKPSASNLYSNNSTTMTMNQSTPESLQLMVKVLQTQRDRNKDRLAFCETRLLNLQQQLDQEVAAKQQLEQDNVALYRKVKFLQSYHGSSSGGGGGMGEGRLIDDPYRVSEGGVGDIESRYSALYEARLNPFAEFSSLERQRKLRELSVADRIVLNTAVAIVSNSTGRSFLLFYLGAMHLLVFGTMYYLAHSVPHSSSYVQCITDPHQAQLH